MRDIPELSLGNWKLTTVPMFLGRTLFCLLILLVNLGVMEVPAFLETGTSPYQGDSVDDIALWIHPTNPEKSLVIATLKRSNVIPPLPTGILVFDLKGKQTQFLKGGTPNNVDLREGFTHEGETFALIAANNWADNSVSFYKINQTNLQLEPLLSKSLTIQMEFVKGLCMHKSGERFYYFLASGTGLVHQYEIASENGFLVSKRIRRIKLDSRAEGCVVDDINHRFYVAEETRGIWRLDTRPDHGNKRELIDSTSWFGDLYRDIEGLSLFKSEDGGGYLIASSQQKNRFVVYDRISNQLLGSFTIVNNGSDNNGSDNNGSVDGVTYTDGIEASSLYLGENFPEGIFIAQDNDNFSVTNERLNQNFKMVNWHVIQEAIDKM